jgi:hypothetical protein
MAMKLPNDFKEFLKLLNANKVEFFRRDARVWRIR